MQEKEGNPVPKQSPSPLYPESLNLPSRLSHASSAELWSTLYKSEPSSNLWWKCVRIWRRESGRFGTSKQCLFFSQPKFYFVSPLLNVVRSWTVYNVKVLWSICCCCTKFGSQIRTVEQHYLRDEHEDKKQTPIPSESHKWHFKIVRVARMYFYHSETNCCLKRLPVLNMSAPSHTKCCPPRVLAFRVFYDFMYQVNERENFSVKKPKILHKKRIKFVI